MKIHAAILSMLLACLAAAYADSMKLGDATIRGMFQSCHKGTITFMDFQSNAPVTADFSKVSRIRFDKPANATFLTLTDGKKQPRNCKIKSYSAKNGFTLIVDGNKMNVRPNQLAKLDAKIDLKEFSDAREAFNAEKQADNKDMKPQKVSKLIPKGKAALVHFDDGSAPSIRQGHLCERLCQEKSDGRILYLQIPCTVGSEMAAKNGVQSTPQFWYVKTDGSISAKLTDTFTEEQISKAFEQLKKGR